MAEGAPTQVMDIVQTPDGYLWLGGVAGLDRFDGATFHHVPSPGEARQSEAVIQLLAARDGSLWASHDYGGLSVLRNGRWRAVPEMGISSDLLTDTRDGDVWNLEARNGRFTIYRWHNGGVIRRSVPFDDNKWSAQKAHIDVDGTIWVRSETTLLHLGPRDQGFVEDFQIPRYGAFARDPSGKVWLVSEDGLQRLRIDGGKASLGPLVKLATMPRVPRILFERGGGLWQISQQMGVMRYALNASQTVATSQGAFPSVLISRAGRPLLVDREGNLWIGSKSGLDQFRRVAFSLLPLASREAGAVETTGSLLRDGRGTVYAHQEESVYALDGIVPRRLDVSVTGSDLPCASWFGGLWIDRGNELFRVDGPRAETRRLGTAISAYRRDVCAEDRDGRLWLPGLSGLLGFVGPGGETGGVDLLTDDAPPYAMINDRSGNVLPYVGRGSLWRTKGAGVEQLWPVKKVTVGAADFLYQGPRYLYVGGPKGLARYDGASFKTVTAAQLPFVAFVSGMVQTSRGETWLQNANSVVRLRTADLDRAYADKSYLPTFERFDIDDGVPGTSEYSNRSTVTEDRDGRIWVATNQGIGWANPDDIPYNRVAPPMVIESIVADGQTMPVSARVELPKGTSRLEITYAGISLTLPSRNRYRYRLIGVDRTWVNAGSQHTATYNNIRPGNYVFEVVATNNSGVPSSKAATIAIEIKPNFVQSWWFVGIVAALIGLLIWSLHRYRLGRMARSLNLRHDERLAERSRIARELHDTLLQSVQGMILRLQAAADRATTSRDTRELLQPIIGRAEEALIEGRNRVQDLRSSDPVDLEALLLAALDLSDMDSGVNVAVSVEGGPIVLDAPVAAEVGKIVSEALINVRKHAHASEVSLSARRDSRQLLIKVRDNGTGFLPEVMPGHFGIKGMRERVQRLGGDFDLTSIVGEGATISVSVPVARGVSGPGRARGAWLTRFFGRSTAA